MNAQTGRRLLWLLAALAVVAIIAVLAYGVGAAHSGGVAAGPFFGRMGYMMGRGYGLGLLGTFLFVALIVGVVLWLFSGPRYGGAPRYYGPTSSDPGGRGGVDQLKELADLHDRGQLTDEEFAAAKRRLLGL